jgi:hypothetical protein
MATGAAVGAQPRTPGEALAAVAARRRPAERDGDARGEPGGRIHAGTERLNDASSLVTDDEGTWARPLAVANVEVRVADPARGHPDDDLAGDRLVKRDLFDRDRLAGSFEDRGAGHATVEVWRASGAMTKV